MKINKTTLGRQAEETACRFLESKGLSLLKRNFHCYFGEIDLIMTDQSDIVFIEVRSRATLDYGSASESITAKKIKKIVKTAAYFLQSYGYFNKINSRFDIVAIQSVAQERELEWIKNAFTM